MEVKPILWPMSLEPLATLSSAMAEEIARPVVTGEELTQLQEVASRVVVDETLVDYMLAVVERTRKVPERERVGGSEPLHVTMLRPARTVG